MATRTAGAHIRAHIRRGRFIPLLSVLLLSLCSACAHSNAEPQVTVRGQYDVSVGKTW